MLKIILIDDHEIVRLGLRSIIQTRADLEIVGEAGTREEALRLIEETCPDLAIVDLVIGRDDGVAFVKECRGLHENLRILVLTIQEESIYAERVIRAGADGFLAKDKAAEEVLRAIKEISAGGLYLSRASSSRILGRVLREPTPHGDNPVTTLSDRELHVFQMIGNGLGTKRIAESLHLSRKTVETYREKIKAKLDLENGTALKQTAEAWVNDGRL